MQGRYVVAVIAAALSMACASSGTSGAAGGSRTSSGSQDVITEADIQGRAADAANALQIIQKLRPQMLRNRGLAVLPTAGRTAAATALEPRRRSNSTARALHRRGPFRIRNGPYGLWPP